MYDEGTIGEWRLKMKNTRSKRTTNEPSIGARVRFSQMASPGFNPEKELYLLATDQNRCEVWVRDLEESRSEIVGEVSYDRRILETCQLLAQAKMNEVTSGPALSEISDPETAAELGLLNIEFSGCHRLEAEVILLCWAWFEDRSIGNIVTSVPGHTLFEWYSKHGTLLCEKFLEWLADNIRRAGHAERVGALRKAREEYLDPMAFDWTTFEEGPRIEIGEDLIFLLAAWIGKAQDLPLWDSRSIRFYTTQLKGRAKRVVDWTDRSDTEHGRRVRAVLQALEPVAIPNKSDFTNAWAYYGANARAQCLASLLREMESDQ